MKKFNFLSNLWSLLVGSRKDNGSSRLRVDYVSITSRLRVWHVLCSRMAAVFLLLLTLSIGNAWGASCDLMYWDKSSSSYVKWKTISEGYTLGSYEYPTNASVYFVAWAPATYGPTSTYPSDDNLYYYGGQTYGKLVNDVAYTPDKLYAVYTADYSTYTSAPNVQLGACDDLADASSLAVNTAYVSGGNTYVRFTWTLGTGTSTNATYQKFCYGLDGNSGSCVSTISKSATYTGDLRSKLSNGKYWWSIQALGDGSTYCDGNAVDGPAFCIDDIKSATPTGIGATITSASTATITWSAVSDAAYYDIEVKNNSTNAVVCSDEVEGTTFYATSLAVNTEYRVELKAFNGCDEGSVKSTSYTFTIVQYTVHWYVNGELWEGVSHGSPTTAVLSGAKPSVWPTPPVAGDDGCGDKFIGWTKCAISGSVGSTSSVMAGGCGLYTTQAGLPAITADTNFYAVFADEEP